jgi:peptidyl-prolyl cis-trans isomerase SurA
MHRVVARLASGVFAAAAVVSCLAFGAEGERDVAGRTVLLDRVVAIVNNEVITKQELDEQLKLATRQLSRQGTPLPQTELLEKQLLERMVTTRILDQVGKETGIRVDDAQLNRAIARLAKDNRMSIDEFRNALAEDGIDYAQFRENVRSEIVITRLREREVDSRIVVSDAEVESYLKAQQASGRDTEFNLLHILVTVPEAATPEQIQSRRARAEEALAKLKRGDDFRQVSSTYSDAPNALEGGELGWRDAGRLPSLFAQAVATLKPGDLTPILRSPNGFHILKLLDRRSRVEQVVVEQTHARHILIRLNEVVSEAEVRRRLLEIRAAALGGTDFGELARQNSEDASAVRGGDLGWLSPGDTVPDFERAMDALAPGEISEPVQSPFGWHLIQVLERRTEDMTQERQRQMARMAIRSRKAEEAFTDWVRQQRDRAFVELRLEDR